MRAKRHRLAERRKNMGFTQEGLAEAVGVDRSTVVRCERSESDPQPCHRPRLAAVLGVSAEELATMLAPSGESPVVGSPGITDDLETVRALRRSDREIGGARLYESVSSYLHQTVAPRVFGFAHGPESRATLAAAATLTEMAGWMAHESGKDSLAVRHFTMASMMARGLDRALAAHIFGSLAHLALRMGNPDLAARYVQHGTTASPQANARLLALRARTHAAVGERDECLVSLERARKALPSTATENPGWASDFDEAAFAIDAARCFRQLNEPERVQEEALRALTLRSPTRTRSRAYAGLLLVSALLSRKRNEEAFQAADRLLAESASLSSAPVLRQFAALDRRLAAADTGPEVRALRARLRARCAAAYR